MPPSPHHSTDACHSLNSRHHWERLSKEYREYDMASVNVWKKIFES